MDGWREALFGQPRYARGDCATMRREKDSKERVEGPGDYVDDRGRRDHFYLVPVSFRIALPHFGGLSLGDGWNAVT